MRVEDFLTSFAQWARTQPDLEGVGLVGSHARGAATAGSDVDLLIVTTQRERYFTNRAWTSLFGEVGQSEVEDRGIVTSLRVRYSDGLEIEYGFATPEWGIEPIDQVTLRVVSDGMRILYDPQELLRRVQRQAEQGRT